MPASSSSTTTAPETVYFAYGPHLSLSHILHRCPSSRYLGPAHLPNYRFQINSLGHANVVPCPGEHVQGLCYLLTPEDEARLDRAEGVRKKVVEKIGVEVEVFKAAAGLVGRRVCEILDEARERAQRKEEKKAGSLGGGGGGEVIHHSSSSHSTPTRDKEREREREGKEARVHWQESPRVRWVEFLAGGTRAVTPHPTANHSSSSSSSSPDSKSRARSATPNNGILRSESQRKKSHDRERSESRSESRSEGGERTRDKKYKLKRQPPVHAIYPHGGETLSVTVYLSRTYNQDGEIKKDYARRMSNGIRDALKLGLESSYVERCLRPKLGEKGEKKYGYLQIMGPEDASMIKPAISPPMPMISHPVMGVGSFRAAALSPVYEDDQRVREKLALIEAPPTPPPTQTTHTALGLQKEEFRNRLRMSGGKLVRKESKRSGSSGGAGGSGGNVMAGQKRSQSMTPGEREVIERVVKERAAKIREKRGMDMNMF